MASSEITKEARGPHAGLRQLLLHLRPAGAEGFEGLMATLLSALTGLTFRLARSGHQFGRDATTPRGRFAIAMEAKRYADNLTLEDLAGKVMVAAADLGGDIDLWVLCATSEVGEGTLAGLEGILEDRGMSLLVLDWAERPLPRLAVLVAAQAEEAVGWFGRHAPDVDPSLLRSLAEGVGRSPGFAQEKARILDDTTGHLVGLGTLAEANRRWTESRFSDRLMSRRAFGQFLTVQGTERPASARPAVESALEDALSSGADVVALLGGEGAGKTWAAARWWVAAGDRPILLFSPALSAADIDPTNPLSTIAGLLARQDDGHTGSSAERWLRRLKRWRTRGADGRGPRFILVLDGLNETSGTRWADVIVALAPEMLGLGGRLVVTCRTGFWQREVSPRLAGLLRVTLVTVPDFADEELRAVLERANVRAQDVPDRVREFMRNPRVCSVALSILDRLKAQPSELTVERLLLEYWRHRLEERGDGIGHSVADFDRLLRSHARSVLSNRSASFDRDAWQEHSGAVRRGDLRRLRDDLTEIEEGRFLRPAPGRPESYEFREEVLPYALGLLMIGDLADVVSRTGRDPSDVWDEILEETGGFDLVGEALGAAAGIACADDRYADSIRSATLVAWLRAQNVSDDSLDSLSAYAPSRPVALLDAAEDLVRDPGRSGRRDWLVLVLLHARDIPVVADALRLRLPRWWAQWSRQPRSFDVNDDGEKKRTEEQAAAIRQRLESLSASERQLLADVCTEVSSPEHVVLDLAAAVLTAGREQALYARELVGWALASCIADDPFHRRETVNWSLRLNGVDHPSLGRAVSSVLEDIQANGPSQVGKDAAALLLRALGDEESSRAAQELSPVTLRKGWRLVEEFCATDPLDPDSHPPGNLGTAIGAAAALDLGEVWNHLGQSETDRKLDMILPGLARFAPGAAFDLVRKVCLTAPARTGLPLRQLGWELPDLAPVLDAPALAAVRELYDRIVGVPGTVAEGDRGFVSGNVLLALLPSLPAEEQLALLRRLPSEVNDWSGFQHGLDPLPAEALEAALLSVEQAGNPTDLRRVLLFASARRPVLTDTARQSILRAMAHPERLVANLAANVAHVACDRALNAGLLDLARSGELRPDDRDAGFWRARAVASAVLDLKRTDDLDLVMLRFLGPVSRALGGACLARMADGVEAAVGRLLNVGPVPEPVWGSLVRQSDGEMSEPVTRAVNVQGRNGGAGTAGVDFGETEGDRARIALIERREALLREEANDYLEALASNDAEWVFRAPERSDLMALVGGHPDRVRRLLDDMMAVQDQWRLRSIRTIGLALASAYAGLDPVTAGRVFDHLSTSESCVRLVFGDAAIPSELVALFGAADHPEFDRRRVSALERAMDDAAIEDAVLAAGFARRNDWLDGWCKAGIGATEPGRVARVLTVCGFRTSNPLSDEILRIEWSRGFLGSAAEAARDAYRRDSWCRFWTGQALSAKDGQEFWRHALLAEKTADRRFDGWLKLDMGSEIPRRFGTHLRTRLARHAKQITKKRGDTLFGHPRPDKVLERAITE